MVSVINSPESAQRARGCPATSLMGEPAPRASMGCLDKFLQAAQRPRQRTWISMSDGREASARHLNFWLSHRFGASRVAAPSSSCTLINSMTRRLVRPRSAALGQRLKQEPPSMMPHTSSPYLSHGRFLSCAIRSACTTLPGSCSARSVLRPLAVVAKRVAAVPFGRVAGESWQEPM